MKKKIALLYGGKSAEHDVSLLTAKAVISALDFTKYEVYPIFIAKDGNWNRGAILENAVENVKDLKYTSENGSPMDALSIELDVVFPLLHGPNGEDGTVQGLLELLNMAYVGNGILASSAGMDKIMMKMAFAQAGLKQAKYCGFIRSEWTGDTQKCYDIVEKELGFPCYVKPANLGSSVGISKCNSREALQAAFEEAFSFDRKVIIEENIVGREVEIAVLGNDNPMCSIAGELAVTADFYDYEAKYINGSTGLQIPALITDEQHTLMTELAIRAFKSLDCSGLVRADFFLTEDGEFLINEVNTMPGFTPISMYPMLWQKTGFTYAELIEELVNLGIERHQEKQLIKFTQ